MAKKKEDQNTPETAGSLRGHYDPLPPQYIKMNGKMYCYNFTKLRWEQAMIAEEKGNLKKQRIEAFSENTNIPESQMDMNYIAELASLLFVSSPDRKPKIWSETMAKETIKNFKETENPENMDKALRCLRDFFMRRNKRILASVTLMRTGSLDRTMLKMRTLASQIYSNTNSGTKGSITRGNSTGGQEKGSEAPPSGS